MKKKVALALMSLLTLSTTINNYSNIWASEATIDIVSAIPKDAITVTRSESVTLKHDYVVIVDRSALPSNDYRQKVDKFVKRLVDSLGESDRVAIGYGTSKSSRLKLTQPLTSDKQRFQSNWRRILRFLIRLSTLIQLTETRRMCTRTWRMRVLSQSTVSSCTSLTVTVVMLCLLPNTR